MRTVRGLVGMPVVVDGRKVGSMLQADISEDLRRLEGIWVGAGLRGARYIPSDSLELLGGSAIIADACGRRRRGRARPLFRRAVSTDGRRLGAITGAEIDGVSFLVTALELSAGLWDDLFTPRQRVTRFTMNRETGDVIVDPAGQEMEAEDDEGRNAQGCDHRDADRRIGGHDLRRQELADREEMEPESP